MIEDSAPSTTTSECLSVAQFLTLQINNSDKSRTEIAQKLGYTHLNIITMFKQGKTKVPIGKVNAIAGVLEVDLMHFLRLVMRDLAPLFPSSCVSDSYRV